jgi:uncharacterized protein (TIGR03083 family)
MSDQPIVDDLATVWQAIDGICAKLTPEAWATATDCPGWSVQDLLSHITGTESALLGRPRPAHTPTGAGSLPNKIAEFNEVEVAYRRSWPGERVLAEFREVTASRLAALRALSDEDFARERDTPLGRMPTREFLGVRILDCWVHEQDMRRALGCPGGFDEPAARRTVARLVGALPYVVGKKAAAPDGTTVVFAITGPLEESVGIGVEGRRARTLQSAPAVPAVRIVMDTETFVCLVCGRWDPAQSVRDGRVRLAGDVALGERIVHQLNIMM